MQPAGFADKLNLWPNIKALTMKCCVYCTVVVILLNFVAAVTVTVYSSGNAKNPNADVHNAADNSVFVNSTAPQKLAIIADDAIQTELGQLEKAIPGGTSFVDRSLEEKAPPQSSPCFEAFGNQDQFSLAPDFRVEKLRISVTIGKHRNNSEKSSAPWFLDGPAGDSIHAGLESSSKALGGINPYIPQQESMHHHDAFIRFISDDSAARGRLIITAKFNFYH
jgi:hypothetical protein